MKGWSQLGILVLLILAGCMDETDGADDVDSPPDVEPTAPMVLVDTEWRHTNRPNPTGEDIEITRFNLPPGIARLDVLIEQIEKPLLRAFADNGRAYGPNDTFAQGAFENGQTPGEVHLSFRNPPAGEWMLALQTDEFQPLGEHRLKLTATGYP
jgi:hypothetical protein